MSYLFTAMGYTAVGYACWKLVGYVIICILNAFGYDIGYVDEDEEDDDLDSK